MATSVEQFAINCLPSEMRDPANEPMSNASGLGKPNALVAKVILRSIGFKQLWSMHEEAKKISKLP